MNSMFFFFSFSHPLAFSPPTFWGHHLIWIFIVPAPCISQTPPHVPMELNHGEQKPVPNLPIAPINACNIHSLVVVHFSSWMKLSGAGGCSTGKDACCQAWQPAFNPQHPQGSRREPTPKCPLTSIQVHTVALCIHTHSIYTHTLTHKLSHRHTHSHTQTH